jgi:hypothetical protein
VAEVESVAVVGGDAVLMVGPLVKDCLAVVEGSLEVVHVVYHLGSRVVVGGEVA